MSLSFLPWPIFIVLVTFAAVGMFIIAGKHSSNQKLLALGYLLIGLGAIGTVFIKINGEQYIIASTTRLGIFVLVCTGSGIVISLVGKYLTIRDDLIKKRLFLRIIYGWLGFTFLVGLFLLFVYLKMKNII